LCRAQVLKHTTKFWRCQLLYFLLLFFFPHVAANQI
jgi:hypothetical protein